MRWWTRWWPGRAMELRLREDYEKLAELSISWDEAWAVQENRVLLALEETGMGG